MPKECGQRCDAQATRRKSDGERDARTRECLSLNITNWTSLLGVGPSVERLEYPRPLRLINAARRPIRTGGNASIAQWKGRKMKETTQIDLRDAMNAISDASRTASSHRPDQCVPRIHSGRCRGVSS